MRLVAKFTLTLVLGMSIVLALFGWRSVRRERALLDAYRHRGDALVAHALAAAVSEVWHREGEAAALALLAEADAHDDGLKVRWVWMDARDDDARPSVPIAAPPEPDELVRFEERVGGSLRSFAYMRVDVGEDRVGAIELSESLEEEEQIVRGSVESTAITVGTLAILGGIMALGLGAFFVGRPVQTIVAKTRRIGLGDLGGPLALSQSDELGQVAREIDVMCERLDEASKEIARETAARLAALDQLRHADRLNTVGKLASGIAHELGTPLNVVGGRAKRILRGAPAEEVQDNARIIVEQTDRMTKIIRQLLDFARRKGAQKASTDICAVVREVLALLSPIADKRRVTLAFDCGDADGRAEVDAGQIQQALTNLVVNAIQAMPEGGEVSVRLRRERRETPGGDEAAFLAISVADHGEGIPPEHLPHVFEPFFTTKGVGEGTGLGLSVTWGIVEEHGGSIDVVSELGRGATFTVHIPAR